MKINKHSSSCNQAVGRQLLTLTSILLAATALSAQPGWKTVKDKTGACQISVPPSWTPLSTPGLVNSPQGMTSMLTSGHRPYRPFSAETLKVMNVDKVLENSATRALWANKPVGNPPHVTYHVETPGKTDSCIAEIPIASNSADDDAKKIALSLSKTP
jgi:hypothetical protein